jgi:hypothetical protein
MGESCCRLWFHFHYFRSLSLNNVFLFVKCSSGYAIKPTIHWNIEWYICKLLTNYVLKRIWPNEVSADEYFESCDFSRENTNIETYRCTIYPCLCLIKDEEKYQPARQNMKFVTRSLLSLINKLHILARQADSIFSVSINSHLDNIYLLRCLKSVEEEEEELVNLRIVTRYTHTLIWI